MQRALVTAVLTGLLATTTVVAASPLSGFTGLYDPSYWTTTLINCDGNVNVGSVPDSLTITGCDNLSGQLGSIYYETETAGSGTISVAYAYSSLDQASFDGFQYFVNGAHTDAAFSTASGVLSFGVESGDVFGFRVWSYDNFAGSGVVTLRDFQAPGQDNPIVPEPTSMLLLGAGLAGMAARRWRAGTR